MGSLGLLSRPSSEVIGDGTELQEARAERGLLEAYIRAKSTIIRERKTRHAFSILARFGD
jgi:hypothetical protein